MAVGDQVTQRGHIQFGSLLMGPGTPYRWRTFTGWEQLPGLDSGTVNMADAHGAIPGPLLSQARTLGLDMIVRAPKDQVGAVVGRLASATAPVVDELPFVAWIDERGPLLSWARATRRLVPVNKDYGTGILVGSSVEFVATDPRRYDLTERVITTTLPAPEEGLSWDSQGPAQVLPADQAAGVGETWRWWSDGDPIISGDGTGAVAFQVVADGSEMVWASEHGDYGWPVEPGAHITFSAAVAEPTDATIILRWWSATGTHLGDDADMAGSIQGTAPAGAAWVQPALWFPYPTGPRPVGTSQLLVGGSESLEFPLVFGTPGSSGSLAAINHGNAHTHPVIEFRGPALRPALTNVTTGDTIEYDLPLATGDVLVVDTRAGTVTLNGSASRLYTATAQSVPEKTFTLPPETTSSFMFRADPDSDPAASVTVRYRSAFW